MRKPKIMTSQTHPLYVGMVELGPGFGRIGLTLCPGKRDAKSPTGRVWARDLPADIRAIRATGANIVVSLIEAWEFEHLEVTGLGRAVTDAGMGWLHLPIRDVDVPTEEWDAIWAGGVAARLRRVVLDEEGTVVFHCRGGLGRAGTVATRLLVDCGWAPSEALAMVRDVREGAVETEYQEAYVLRQTPTP